jgi:hypothetical protein
MMCKTKLCVILTVRVRPRLVEKLRTRGGQHAEAVRLSLEPKLATSGSRRRRSKKIFKSSDAGCLETSKVLERLWNRVCRYLSTPHCTVSGLKLPPEFSVWHTMPHIALPSKISRLVSLFIKHLVHRQCRTLGLMCQAHSNCFFDMQKQNNSYSMMCREAYKQPIIQL